MNLVGYKTYNTCSAGNKVGRKTKKKIFKVSTQLKPISAPGILRNDKILSPRISQHLLALRR